MHYLMLMLFKLLLNFTDYEFNSKIASFLCDIFCLSTSKMNYFHRIKAPIEIRSVQILKLSSENMNFLFKISILVWLTSCSTVEAVRTRLPRFIPVTNSFVL